jgi:tetratricopeptide (TPR) repeat protein
MSDTLPNSVLHAVRNRRALLWICQRHDLLPSQSPHDYGLPFAEASLRYRRHPSKFDVALASLYWEAVWLEGAASPLMDAIRTTLEGEPSARRRNLVTLASAPDAQAEVSQEFLPVCVLPGVLDSSAPPTQRYGVAKKRPRERIAWDLAARLAKYPGRALIAIGARSQDDVSLLYEVLEDCPITDLDLVLVSLGDKDAIAPPENEGVRFTLWTDSEVNLCDVLTASGAPTFRALPEWAVRCANRTIPLSAKDVQRIEKRFSLISETDHRPPEQFTMDDLQRFLRGDLTTWSAFALGVPVQREYKSEGNRTLDEEVEDALKRVSKGDDSLRTFSIRLPCEPGSGATTLIRRAAFAAAAAGYPTLVLRPDQVDIDREELIAFATTLSESALREGVKNPPPLLVVVDVEHEAIPDVFSLAESLATHGRSAVILQATSSHGAGPHNESRRRRAATLLPLRSISTASEVKACSRTFEDLVARWQLPISVPPIEAWSTYASSATMHAPTGEVAPETTFWIALRFFLVEGMEFSEAERALDAMGNWMRKRCDQITDTGMLEVVKYVAALSAFRIVSPLWTVLRPVTGGSFDSGIVATLRQLEGVVEWGTASDELHDQALRFLHPTLAVEFLRLQHIRSESDTVAALKPVLSSLSSGHPGDVWIAQTLAANVLAPTYEERLQTVSYDWRLEAFEVMPPALSEQSKAILHHWARCLYQSVDPRFVREVNPELQRGRLESAIDKLNRAAQLPRREGRDEHPSHIFNTLGTAHARYAMYLDESAKETVAIEAAWDSACDAFRKSIELLPNIEALLAFGHRLLMRTKVVGDGQPAPTTETVEYVAEALSLLDEAEELMTDHSNPQEEWWTYLHRDKSAALNWLDTDLARQYLHQLRESGRPSLAYYCEARLALGTGDEPKQIDAALSIAESAHGKQVERSVPLILFHLSLLRRHPTKRFDFERQEDLYLVLDKMPDYAQRPIDRFRHAVTCYQIGKYREGEERFRKLREEFRKTGGPQFFGERCIRGVLGRVVA